MNPIVAAVRPIRYWFDDVSYKVAGNKSALLALKDKHKGKPMLVVGNGPSLNQTPLEEFAYVPAIGMNKIDLLFSRSTWRPSMIVCANDAVVMQHKDAFSKSDIPVWLGWKARWYMPRHNKNVSYYLNRNATDFRTDLENGISVGHTVTFVALQLAYWMGADPVIVFGVDHSFAFAGKAQEYVRWKGPDVNHFDPNYFQHGSLFGNPNLETSEQQYAEAQQVFEADGRKIYDATVGGKLQIFEKIDLAEARRLSGVSA